MSKQKWLDTHTHVSNIAPDGRVRQHFFEDLIEVLDRCDADLRFVISCDGPWPFRMMKDADAADEANRFIYDLVRRAPGRLYGSCTVNPHFLDASLRTMEKCFSEWGFVQLGEMLQFLMKYKMDSDPVEKIVRMAVKFDVPVQIHISDENPVKDRPSSFGMEQLVDLFGIAERVPEAKYILAHAVGAEDSNPPVVDQYLSAIEKKFGRWPQNFWIEIKNFNSPGVCSTLARVPSTRIIAGTDWVSRIGPPFLPYGIIFGVESPEENPYPPRVASMRNFLKKEGASEDVISQVGFENAAKLFRLQEQE